MEYDFSKIYRAQQWYDEVLQNNPDLNIPLMIPSYKRPNAPIFSQLKDFKKSEVHIFIRNTPEEQNSYEHLYNQFTIHNLPDWVSDIGTTREAIVQYAIDSGFENIFMFDDRITDVRTLAPKFSTSGKSFLTAVKNSKFRPSLLVWQKILELCPFTLSCPAHAGFSYFAKYINAPYEINGGNIAAAISINVQDFRCYDLHYQPLSISGHDDFAILIDVMMKGLPTCKISDLEYAEISSDKISGGTHLDNESRIDAVVKRNEILKEYLIQKLGDYKPYMYIRKIREVPYCYLKWTTWKKFYNDHAVKKFEVSL